MSCFNDSVHVSQMQNDQIIMIMTEAKQCEAAAPAVYLVDNLTSCETRQIMVKGQRLSRQTCLESTSSATAQSQCGEARAAISRRDLSIMATRPQLLLRREAH